MLLIAKVFLEIQLTKTIIIYLYIYVCFAFSKLNVLNLKNPDLSALFKTMQTIADFVGKNQWHHAREEWIQFIKLPTTTKSNRQAIYSCYGTEQEMIYMPCAKISQLYNLVNKCSNRGCKLYLLDDQKYNFKLLKF